MEDIVFVLGTRPQLIKSAPVIKKLIENDYSVKIIHTGQHYDYEMTKIFFEEFNLPDPYFFLNVGSGSHGYQIATIIERLEKILASLKPRIVVVPGDTNSALAASLISSKLNILTCHLEAGLRLNGVRIQEEINRKVIDSVSHILFAPTATAKLNLLKEGVEEKRVYQVGDTMLDALLSSQRWELDRIDVLSKHGLNKFGYVLMTLHRDFNVDNPSALKAIIEGVIEGLTGSDIKLVFLVHPRTRDRLVRFGLFDKLRENDRVLLLPPQGYFETIAFLRYSIGLLTDSGGLQKEAFILGKKIVTFRNETEWVETVESGYNKLVGTDVVKIRNALLEMIQNKEKYYLDKLNEKAVEIYGEGKASQRILKVMDKIMRVELDMRGYIDLKKLLMVL